MINQVLNNIFYIVQNITSKYNIKYDVKQSIDRVTKITNIELKIKGKWDTSDYITYLVCYSPESVRVVLTVNSDDIKDTTFNNKVYILNKALQDYRYYVVNNKEINPMLIIENNYRLFDYLQKEGKDNAETD